MKKKQKWIYALGNINALIRKNVPYFSFRNSNTHIQESKLVLLLKSGKMLIFYLILTKELLYCPLIHKNQLYAENSRQALKYVLFVTKECFLTHKFMKMCCRECKNCNFLSEDLKMVGQKLYTDCVLRSLYNDMHQNFSSYLIGSYNYWKQLPPWQSSNGFL